jgi:hypothetical protein
MASSEESDLDSALRRGLKGIDGLPESARYADESITRYLNQKVRALLLREYRKRSNRNEDETAIAERTTEALDEVVLDAQKVYRLFELHMNNRLDEFWEGLNLEGKAAGAAEPATELEKAAFTGSYPNRDLPTSIGVRRFHCTEGCDFEGELAYLAHRDRGHHPIPA